MYCDLVSVIMSVYNGEDTIEKSILSIINQDYENLELLLLDDCSDDNTFEICKKYSESSKKVKLYKNEKNLGLTASLNILINESKGSYIARQDADDISFPNRISSQINFIKKFNLDACSSRAYVIEYDKITPAKSFYLPKKFVMNFKNPFIHGTLVIKKDVLNNIGNYDENFFYSQDFKLMKDLLNHKYRLKIIKEPLYFLNMNGNISVNYKKRQKYYADCVIKNLNPTDF